MTGTIVQTERGVGISADAHGREMLCVEHIHFGAGIEEKKPWTSPIHADRHKNISLGDFNGNLRAVARNIHFEIERKRALRADATEIEKNSDKATQPDEPLKSVQTLAPREFH